MRFVLQLINGLQLGSIYALIALGYSMVYGIIKLLNFAHADVIMVGIYAAFFSIAQQYFGLPPAVAVAITVVFCVVLSVLIEKLAYRPLRSAPRISVLITALGVSLLLQNLAQLFFSPDPRTFPVSSLIPPGQITLGEIQLTNVTLTTFAVSLLSMVGLTILVQRTKLGKAMRAVSEDAGAAQLMGINVNTIITFTFAVGAALAGIGAVLYGAGWPLFQPTTGIRIGMIAFVAAVIGGIGSIPGAMIGGFAVGLLEVTVAALRFSGWVDGAVFMILILVLMFRPTGIMGRNMMEKV